MHNGSEWEVSKESEGRLGFAHGQPPVTMIEDHWERMMPDLI